MARTGSSTAAQSAATGDAKPARRSRAKAKTDTEAVPASPVVEIDTTHEIVTEAAPAEVVTESSPNEVEETTDMSDTTVETEVTETPASDTTVETAAVDTEAAAKAAETEAANEALYTDFESAVQTAVADRDVSTGTLPEVQTEAVKEKYRALPGAKYKNRAKKHLNDELKNAVNAQDLILGTAVMGLADAIENAGPAAKAPVERKPADPAAAYRDRLATLHIAYNLARENTPDGIDVDAERAKVEEQVGQLTAQAETYYAWVTSQADDKGDEPEVDPIVKKAVKASQGKAASAGRASGTSTPRVAGDGPRRSVRTHIAQVFDKLGKGSGEFLKVAAIANEATDEYPGADCSPGAITAALKSAKGVEGFELASDDNGISGARKL